MTINILSYFPSLTKAAFSLPKDFLLHFLRLGKKVTCLSTKVIKAANKHINKTIQK